MGITLITLICIGAIGAICAFTNLFLITIPPYFKAKKMVAGTWWRAKNGKYTCYIIGRKGKMVLSTFLLDMPWGNILSDQVNEDKAYWLAAISEQITEPENYIVKSK